MSALSARADGEDPGLEARLLDAHLATCDHCRRFDDGISATRRMTAVGEAPSIPDMSKRVVGRNAAADRLASWGVARGLLLLVAVQVAAFAVPELLGNVHSSRHLGALSLAYAGGLVMVVIRPARARTMLNVSAILVAALLVTAVVDVAQGRAPLIYETSHIPEVLSVVLLWVLARPDRDAVADPATRASSAPLRLVTEDAEQKRTEALDQHPSGRRETRGDGA